MRQKASATRSRPAALLAGGRLSAPNRAQSGHRKVVRGGVGVFGVVPRGLNYVASMETLAGERR